MKTSKTLLAILAAAAAALPAGAQTPTPIPADYALPAGAVNTAKPGFLSWPYQTAAAQPSSIAWTEEQYLGLHGPNLADLSGADANGYYTVPTVVNWNITDGGTVNSFPPADPFPGIGASGTDNFSENVITYLTFPTAGVYTLGVNSDDGFRVTTSKLNPKDSHSAITLGQWDSSRGAADTTFQISITEAGTYPFRLLYEEGGGGASCSWFSVLQDGTQVLINDTTQPNAIRAFAAASIVTPYLSSFVHNGTGFTFTIKDEATLNPASVVVKFNGSVVTTTSSSPSSGGTQFQYTSPALVPPGSSNSVVVQFSDTATPPYAQTVPINYVESSYTALPPSFAAAAGTVDTTKPGFLWRPNQIDSSDPVGALAANIAHAEAQLAGLLIDPGTGSPYVNTATAGEQPDGRYAISGVLNFSQDASDQGNFAPDVVIPGLGAVNGDNIAGEFLTYLDLQPGFYQFGISSSDGFRVTAGANASDALATQVGIYDLRRITHDTTFSFTVQTAGIYPFRIVWFRQGNLADNGSSVANFEFYTVASDGTKILVNDSTKPQAVKAYWKSTGAFDPYLKYAGPTSFISEFHGANVGFTSVDVQIADGSSKTVDKNSVALSIDGTNVTVTATSASGITSASWAPSGLLLPRTQHTAQLVYAETGGGASHTNTWQFNSLRRYELPAPLFSENFDSTAQGATPTVPTGWVEENHTTSLTAGLDPTDLNSDYFLGWVVVGENLPSKALGVAPNQVLNGVAFDADTNPLLSGNSLYAESDVRNGSQIQYLTTPSYNLTGKTGIVISFTSGFEQNQDSLNALEYSADGGTNWNPVFYWLQGPDDSQNVSDVLRDGSQNLDAVATLTQNYTDLPSYTNTVTGQLVGGFYGAFIKSPISQALAPYIDGRVNDDAAESKRIEVYQVPLADNAADVKFRFVQAGTGSWYWAVDNWAIYSVPSLVTTPIPTNPTLTYAVQNGAVVITYTGTLQKASTLGGAYTAVAGATSPYTVKPADGDLQFFRASN